MAQDILKKIRELARKEGNVRQMFTIKQKLSDGRVIAESARGDSCTLIPDPASSGWKVGDQLDVLAAPVYSGLPENPMQQPGR